jgi:hypothetical protein
MPESTGRADRWAEWAERQRNQGSPQPTPRRQEQLRAWERGQGERNG